MNPGFNTEMIIYFTDYVGIDFWLPSLVLLLVYLFILWRRGFKLSYVFFLGIFGYYVLYSVRLVFFPFDVWSSYADGLRELEQTIKLNLNPLATGSFGVTWRDVLPLMLLNILLTIPFGFGINFVARITEKRILWIAPLTALSLEGMQLLLTIILGYAYRVIDVNDFIMNTLGIFIGYGLFRVFSYIYLWSQKVFAIEFSGLTHYVYDVARFARDSSTELTFRRHNHRI